MDWRSLLCQRGTWGVAGLLVGAALGSSFPLAAVRLGALTDSGASLLGSAIGAAAGIVAAIAAIWLALRLEQLRLREYVAACVQDVADAADEVGRTPAADATQLSSEQWADFRRRVNDLSRECTIAEGRLKRIEAVAYKLDAQSLRWLLELEAVIATGQVAKTVVDNHGSRQEVRLYGGPVPIEISQHLGFMAGVLGSLRTALQRRAQRRPAHHR